MCIPTGKVLLSFSTDDSDSTPIAGIAESSDNGRVVAAVDEADWVQAAPGAMCQVRYSDPVDGRFMGLSSVVESVDGGQFTLRVTSEPVSVNKRESFRVSTSRSEITASVGSWPDCAVVDIGAGGLRVCVPEQMEFGEQVSVQLRAYSREFEGKFTVRRVAETPAGIQIGLMADPEDEGLARSMISLVADVQRAQLRRRSRVAGDDPRFEISSRASCDGRPPHDPSQSQHRGADIDGDRRVEGIEDRRRSPRSDCTGLVRVVALQGEQLLRLRAELTDISRGGLGLKTPALLDRDVYLIVDFSTPEDSRWVIGRVVYGAIPEGELMCRLGVQFTQGATQTGPVPDSVQEFVDRV